MRTWVIINPKAGEGSTRAADAVQRWASDRENVVCRESGDASSGQEVIGAALDDGADQVVAVGGDGTVNAVVNELQSREADVRLGIIPLGTGNDLARTLDIPQGDVYAALNTLEAGREVQIDGFRLETDGAMRYGINASAGGFSGQVDEALTPEMKSAWGPLAYLVGAAQVFPDLQDYATYITVDDASKQRVRALNIVVANGRTAAGGRPVAPTANPCDGLLDVVIVKRGNVGELAEVATRLVAGNYLESPLVMHQRVRRIEVASDPGMWFNVDGELLTNKPVAIQVLPGCQRVVVGPGFKAAPEDVAD